MSGRTMVQVGMALTDRRDWGTCRVCGRTAPREHLRAHGGCCELHPDAPYVARGCPECGGVEGIDRCICWDGEG